MGRRTTAAYTARAAEYTERFGTMASVHPDDRDLVEQWAASCAGTIVDAGCGPGHWTEHLSALGLTTIGLDSVSWFVEHARRRAPHVDFRTRSLESTGLDTDGAAGVLAWYSLIHHSPDRLHEPIDEFRRVLAPGGRLLIGFFEGAILEPFDHAVTTAYRWPADQLSAALDDRGFTVLDVRRRESPGRQWPAALSTVLR